MRVDPKRRAGGGGAIAAGSILLPAALLGSIAGPSASAPIRFHSEVVRIEVGAQADTVTVDGLYRFVVDPGVRAPRILFYPYPNDSLHGAARTVSLAEVDRHGERRPLAYREREGNRGVLWTLPPVDRDTLEIRTVYRQALRGCTARYIVTTTRAWKRPLAWARFEVRLPESVTDPEFNYPFRRGEDGVHRFEARRFLPERDVVVRWKRRAEGGRIVRGGEGADSGS
ncbi:MAG: hypothetical protein GF346_01550 [Candidatus Eisenbacteria bacterium]|nr:hypothetical protein [Candidatus Latescibacterota bacterium]MBD3301115.1 hypothetical protein [Candidatus Eisenbacteria bacterium]